MNPPKQNIHRQPNYTQSILNCKILIVDDDFLSRTVLKEIFKKYGFTLIEEAENGKDGLKKVLSFKPNLIITDIQMPEMDGLEFCRNIRENPDINITNLPILTQTALNSAADRTIIFASGATDYITKPIDPDEIIARSIVHLENEMMISALREFSVRITQELNTAKETQQVLLPLPHIIKEAEKSYNLQICGYDQTCSELGGDFWGIKSLSNDELAIHMVDFSGHGVNAALNVFRLHAMMGGIMSVANTPSAYMTNLNALLVPLLPKGQFATMFYGVINTKNNLLTYSCAASTAPVLFRSDGTHEILDSTGRPLGIAKDSIFEMRKAAFNKGDCLLLYSDALIETEDTNGAMWPIGSIIDTFQSKFNNRDDQCQIAFDEFLKYFNQHYPKLDDDLTLSAFYRLL